MSVLTSMSATVRPFSYWLEHHPPGYLSRDAAANVQPVALAEELYTQGIAFADWLSRPPSQRWDSFALQVLSAHLFSRFRTVDAQARVVEVALLDLDWPPGSAPIVDALQSLQELLAPSFSLFRAVRAPLEPQDFPTPEELRMAEEALQSAHGPVCQALTALRSALDTYTDALQAGGR